jgi:hypothetical protein
VGYSGNQGGGVYTLAEHWNGANWAIQSTPSPSSVANSSLSAVSCYSATACTAVGDYLNASGVLLTLVEHWNGAQWSVQSTPNPSGATSSVLRGVSCLSATDCTAVGYSSDGTLAEFWNGKEWTIQTTPEPAADSGLEAVSCPSATACTAVGYYNTSSSGLAPVMLAEHWNGTHWAVQSTPNPSGQPVSTLDGVSCPSGTACTAVGFSNSTSGAASVTLAERWNGTHWAVQSTPNPAGEPSPTLSGVSCPSSTACIAVGFYENDSTGAGGPLAEQWNGTSWAVQSTPKPDTSLSGLAAVSCSSITACTAAGDYYSKDTEMTLAERYS